MLFVCSVMDLDETELYCIIIRLSFPAENECAVEADLEETREQRKVVAEIGGSHKFVISLVRLDGSSK